MLSIYDLLKQDEFWFDTQRRILMLEEIEIEHLRKLYNYLFEEAKEVKPFYLIFTKPEAWMARQPLVKRLRAILDESDLKKHPKGGF